LYQALIAEWAPTGVLQEHTVADIARLLAQTKSWERFSWLSLRESIVMQSNLNVLQQP
jgi:hypothetical protein